MNLQNYLGLNALSDKKNTIKKVFFFRVCGTGMGAAACLLKEQGYIVEGADSNFYPPMSTYLESTGIPLKNVEDITDDYLKSFDLIIVGNVVPNGSDDAKKIEEIGTPFTSFPTALGGLLLKDLNVIGIAGTHGKTTTTYFITQMFESLGEDPGYFIGGVIEGRPPSKKGNGKYFFIESDEYDSAYFEKFSKFRSYQLNHMFLTSLEFDHADIFQNIDQIKNEFRVALKNFEGGVYFDSSYQYSNELLDEIALPKYGYGYKDSLEILKEDSEGTEFSLNYNEQCLKFSTNLLGRHNILNLAPCILFSLNDGFSLKSIQESLKNLELVKRRQEFRGKYRESIVIDDFAHHPRAVEYVIDTIKKSYPQKIITVIFEPNSATARSSIFQDEFRESLKIADRVLFAQPKKPTSIKNVGDISGKKICEELNKGNVKAKYFEELNTLRSEIDSICGEDNVFLVLSNGTCLGLWESDFVDELK